MSTTRGIDLSSNNGAQNWTNHKKAGVAFAFVKASEGQHTRDPKFRSHMSGAAAAGMLLGAYHFGWPNQSATTEAANYIDAVKDFADPAKPFWHFLDLERYNDGRNYHGASAAQIKDYVKTWVNKVRVAYPHHEVGVYTSGTDVAAGYLPTGVPLWYPAYPGASVDTYEEAEAHARPAPSGVKPLFWQFTSASGMDRSIAYADIATLRKWGHREETTPMSLTAADKTWLATAIKDGINAYAFAATLGKDVVAAPPDDPNVATNPTWADQSFTKDTNLRVRQLTKQLAALTATVNTMAAAIAAFDSTIDPEALVNQIKAALVEELGKVDVHFDVQSS